MFVMGLRNSAKKKVHENILYLSGESKTEPVEHGARALTFQAQDVYE